jgi:hypothetical protein
MQGCISEDILSRELSDFRVRCAARSILPVEKKPLVDGGSHKRVLFEDGMIVLQFAKHFTNLAGRE